MAAEEPVITVTKSDGTAERFSFEKLRDSLRHSGASPAAADEISAHIAREMVSGMSTADIYRHAFSVLHAKEKTAAARYSLRRSMLALGPTGFPFERFVGELFKRRGYSIALDRMVQGRCVEHEVDMVAWNNERLVMVEAKYHHELAYKTDIKVVLYVKARFDDLRDGAYAFGKKEKMDEGILITNTKFTDKAVHYAACAGVTLVGWNYPSRGNLHDLIESLRLHPITCLTTLSLSQKQALLERGIVLCEHIREKEKEAELRAAGLSESLIREAQAESTAVCSS